MLELNPNQPIQSPESNPTPIIIKEILSIDINTLNTDNITEIANKIQQNKENIRIYTLNSKDTEVLNKLKIVINKVSEIYKERIEALKSKEITTEPLDITKLSIELTKLNPKWSIDTSIEGGVIKTEITEEDLEYLQTMDTAIEQFKGVIVAPACISTEFKKLPWVPIPFPKSLNTVVVDAGEITEKESDKLVEDMKSLGYRPLTVAEFTATAIKRSDLFEKYITVFFNNLTNHKAGDFIDVPLFGWLDDKYWLSTGSLSGGNGHSRFLFVRE